MTTELETRHAALVELINQAYGWTRQFQVSTDQKGDDGQTLSVYPLRVHSEALAGICTRLGGTPSDEARAQSPMRGTNYIEGQDLVLRLDSSSPYRTTHQDIWRAEVARVREHYTAIGANVENIDSYYLAARALFDEAYAKVRAAYADSVAATYGRFWATSSTPEDGRAVILWLKALADVGFSVEECHSVLRDIEIVCPEAALRCRERQDIWFLSHSDT